MLSPWEEEKIFCFKYFMVKSSIFNYSQLIARKILTPSSPKKNRYDNPLSHGLKASPPYTQPWVTQLTALKPAFPHLSLSWSSDWHPGTWSWTEECWPLCCHCMTKDQAKKGSRQSQSGGVTKLTSREGDESRCGFWKNDGGSEAPERFPSPYVFWSQIPT